MCEGICVVGGRCAYVHQLRCTLICVSCYVYVHRIRCKYVFPVYRMAYKSKYQSLPPLQSSAPFHIPQYKLPLTHPQVCFQCHNAAAFHGLRTLLCVRRIKQSLAPAYELFCTTIPFPLSTHINHVSKSV